MYYDMFVFGSQDQHLVVINQKDMILEVYDRIHGHGKINYIYKYTGLRCINMRHKIKKYWNYQIAFQINDVYYYLISVKHIQRSLFEMRASSNNRIHIKHMRVEPKRVMITL